MRPEDFDFQLPPENIAQVPTEHRSASRMLVVGQSATDEDSREVCSAELLAELQRAFPEGALVVVNDSRVVPARLDVERADGRAFELLLTAPSPEQLPGVELTAWVRGAKRLRSGDCLRSGELLLEYLGPDDVDGRARRFIVREGAVLPALAEHGRIPLPPYIRREQGELRSDRERYQTVFAKSPGSVAAPTAGLHFDDAMIEALDPVRITLHVGPGTFLPMDVEDVRDHRVGAERVHVDEIAAQRIANARSEGRPIVAVGTTVTRTLEGLAAKNGGVVVPGDDWIDLVITPGHDFRVISGLLTNFHLPRSSLLMLTCAFGGRTRILNAYAWAVQQGFRFYSYGDCMFIPSRG